MNRHPSRPRDPALVRLIVVLSIVEIAHIAAVITALAY